VPVHVLFRAASTLRLWVVAAVALGLFASPLLAASTSASATVSATAISAGLGQSCALIRRGGVKCWGSNGHDELGDGSAVNRSTPVDVSGLGSGVRAIAAGARHTCALTSAGGVKCWGNNSFGTLGNGTTGRPFTPVDVAGLSSGVTAIAAGLDHSCALTSVGGVKCWGYNRFGELGDGTTGDRSAPVDVVGLSTGVTAIAAGSFQSCALTSAGVVKCWGGTSGNRLTPVDIVRLSGGVRAIAVSGGHGCALTGSGGVKCWGRNDAGQLGDGTTSNSSTPVDVSGLASGVTAITAGVGNSCALTSVGGVKCWGLNDFGQLGDGSAVNRSTPVDVSGLRRGVRAIAAGSFHGCALTSSGGVRCWGLNASGQLGDRTTVNRRTPVGVTGFGAAKAMLTIVSRSVTATPERVAAVRLGCGPQARCQGTLTLTASRLKLGSRAFSIAAGRRQTVKVELTTRGFELLVRVKRLSARVRISYGQPAGGTTTATRAITLTAAG
jgi:alpha-tubulin suppressor-like RCC1 family protein